VAINPLGDIILDLTYENCFLGSAHAPNVIILPGINAYTGWAAHLTPSNLTTLSAMLTRFLAGESFTISAQGAARNASSLPLYAPFLANTSLSASYTGPAQELGLQVRAYIPSIDELIYAIKTYHTVGFPVRVLFHNPFAAPINITRLGLTVWFNHTQIGYALWG
jgi:hypothetical protein